MKKKNVIAIAILTMITMFNLGFWLAMQPMLKSTNTEQSNSINTPNNGQEQVTNTPNINSVSNETTGVTLEKAKQIALKHAELTASQVVFTKAKLETDDGVRMYEIDFSHNSWEYEYEIHAGTGAVLKVDKDEDNE